MNAQAYGIAARIEASNLAGEPQDIYVSPDTLINLISVLDPFQADHSNDAELAGFEPDMERDRR